MLLMWSHPEGFPGIMLSEYKGHKLEIRPAGAFEWDGLVDGVVRAGYDDIEIIEQELMDIIDGVVRDRTITITVMS